MTGSAHRIIRPLLMLLLAVAVLLVAWLWFRDSALVQVEQVEVEGATSSQADAVRAALERAAEDMTTLHVREDVLLTAVRPYASVADVRAHPDFPDKLTIEVVEHRMIAVVDVGGAATAVAAGGRLLRGVEPRDDLPEVDAGRVVASDRLDDEEALAAVKVLAAAPSELHPRVDRVTRGERGMVLEMDRGPDLIFGDAGRIRAKWAAAARVLAEPSAVGAVYLDLRLPERVAAGGVAPTPEPTATPTPVPPSTTPVPTPVLTAPPTVAPTAPPASP